jgi:hypothetical protein
MAMECLVIVEATGMSPDEYEGVDGSHEFVTLPRVGETVMLTADSPIFYVLEVRHISGDVSAVEPSPSVQIVVSINAPRS